MEKLLPDGVLPIILILLVPFVFYLLRRVFDAIADVSREETYGEFITPNKYLIPVDGGAYILDSLGRGIFFPTKKLLPALERIDPRHVFSPKYAFILTKRSSSLCVTYPPSCRSFPTKERDLYLIFEDDTFCSVQFEPVQERSSEILSTPLMPLDDHVKSTKKLLKDAGVQWEPGMGVLEYLDLIKNNVQEEFYAD